MKLSALLVAGSWMGVGCSSGSAANDAAVRDAASDAAVSDGEAGADAGRFTGSMACADLLGGPTWSTTLTPSDFQSEASYNAWNDLNNCACVNSAASTPAGCQDRCTAAAIGGPTPSFCDGASPLSMCTACLNANCSAQSAACMGN